MPTAPRFPTASPHNVPLGPYTVRVAEPGYEKLDPLALPWKELRRNPERFPDWHVAKVSSARTVVGLDVDLPEGRRERIYFKRAPRRTFVARLRALVRPSKEWREWNLAQAIGRAGVWVPRPLFYAEAYDPSVGCPCVFLATKALEPTWREAKEHFIQHRQFDREWRSLAAFSRRLHELEIYHADFRADHLFLDPTRIGVWEDLSAWAMIDLDGSTVGAPIGRALRLRAIEQLAESFMKAGLTAAHLEDFLAIYDPTNQWKFNPPAIIEVASRTGFR